MSIKAVMAFTALATSTVLGISNAATYPDKPIRLIVPTGPGGPTDLLARIVGERASAALGQPVIVENKAGAGGAIAGRFVAASEPDGYTLMLGNTATLSTVPAISRNAGYQPRSDFSAIATITKSYQVFVSNPKSGINTVSEAISHLNKNKGKLNFGAAGIGNLTHLSAELFKLSTDTDFEVVQYKSGGEALTALLAGQIDFSIDTVSAIRPLVSAGRLTPLAVTSAERQEDFPNLPTMKEAGIKDYEVTSFFAVVAPTNTPIHIIQKLNQAINSGLKSVEVQERFKSLGIPAIITTPQELQSLIDQESRKWENLVKSSNLTLD